MGGMFKDAESFNIPQNATWYIENELESQMMNQMMIN
jgi:hypothetical protein